VVSDTIGRRAPRLTLPDPGRAAVRERTQALVAQALRTLGRMAHPQPADPATRYPQGRTSPTQAQPMTLKRFLESVRENLQELDCPMHPTLPEQETTIPHMPRASWDGDVMRHPQNIRQNLTAPAIGALL